MRGDAGLPRQITPVGGPGTRDKTRQAPRHTWQDGHAKKKVGGGIVVAPGLVLWRGKGRSGTEFKQKTSAGCVISEGSQSWKVTF